MTDQLIVFQALADGRCQIDFGKDEDGERTASSLHTQTAHWVAERILRVEWEDGLCEGAGFVAMGKTDQTAAKSGKDPVQNVSEQLASLST